jgi:uncharacterized membrane protein
MSITHLDGALKSVRKMRRHRENEFPVNNVNDLHDDSMTRAQRIADAVARNVGSWRFILIQSSILAMWIAANAAFALHDYALNGFDLRAWDPYPFILLNLALSFQAAYTGPFVMMSQNRQADKDRIAAEHDYHVNIRSEATVHAVLEHLKAQDDVILAILRQLEKVHEVTPGEEQIAAEKRLDDVTKFEGRMVKRWIKMEEQEAGLEADPSAAAPAKS